MKEAWRLSWNIRNFPRSNWLQHIKNHTFGDYLNPKDPFVCCEVSGFPRSNPMTQRFLGCFDHQSYEFSGGVWILRGTSLLARKQRPLIWQRQYIPHSVAHHILSCTHLKENWTATHTRKDLHDNCSRSYHSKFTGLRLCTFTCAMSCCLLSAHFTPALWPFETTKHSFRRVVKPGNVAYSFQNGIW